MVHRRWIAAAAGLLLVLPACGDDDAPGPSTAVTSTTAAVPTTSTTTTEPPAVADQPAVWPATDVVFTTPEGAAEDFIATVFDVAPTLGEFQAGDVRSGEIEVIFPGEGPSSTPIPRSVLFLRRLGPDDGWFVIGAASDNAAIDDPETNAEVPAGPLIVSGRARGFEGTVIVTAFVAGDATPLDEVIAAGGSQATPEAFTAELDLSDLEAGTVVTVLVRGGVGLETDTGDFSAVPVSIGG